MSGKAPEAFRARSILAAHSAETCILNVPDPVTADKRVQTIVKIVHGVVRDDGGHAGFKQDIAHDFVRDFTALTGQLAGVIAHFLQAFQCVFQILGVLREVAHGIKLCADNKVLHDFSSA